MEEERVTAKATPERAKAKVVGTKAGVVDETGNPSQLCGIW